MVAIKSLILTLFFLMEIVSLTIFGYWGFHVNGGMALRSLLGIGAPLTAALLWGSFLAPKARVHISKGPRIVLQLVFFTIAAGTFIFLGETLLSIVFFCLVLIEIFLVNLLKLEISST